jgi:quercetin dioxygenase-like cupin family protein
MMKPAYQRPFQPIHVGPDTFESFGLTPMARQLMREESFRKSGRDALTLVHDRGLTAVLTAAKRGTICGEHRHSGPAMILALSGSLRVSAPGPGKSLDLRSGAAAAVAPRVRHVIEARSNCAFLTLIGQQAQHEGTEAPAKAPSARPARSKSGRELLKYGR